MSQFRILGLDPAPFQHLYGLDDEALRAAGAIRYAVDATPGFPDRVELRDLEPGERALLVHYEHQPAATPYRAGHAIFVLEGAMRVYDVTGALPEVVRRRTLSLRAFDGAGMMVDAGLRDGALADELLDRFFEDERVAYVHAHSAARGCYLARIERPQ